LTPDEPLLIAAYRRRTECRPAGKMIQRCHRKEQIFPKKALPFSDNNNVMSSAAFPGEKHIKKYVFIRFLSSTHSGLLKYFRKAFFSSISQTGKS
jgi:hypothetical protein